MFRQRCLTCVAAALALPSCGLSGSPASLDGSNDALVAGAVPTDRGVVIGHSDGTITAFLGVPYAAPPVGALRWKAPVPPAAWTTPLDAAAFGPACAQSAGGLDQNGPFSEDCLTVNVWTPNPAASAALPVLVFIHGGAFVHGGSNSPTYDGRTLATAGAVVVTMNYRLGVLGFLAHPALTAEDAHHSSGNAGLLDQQAALRWIQTNITGFGGDPGRVTVFGESAGAMSVCAHIASPLAAGLFQRALGQSGSCLIFSTPLASAEALGNSVASALGCNTAADTLACMRGKTADEVIAAAPGSEDPATAGIRLWPNIDGYVLPEPPAAAFAAGRIQPLAAFLGGINRDESTLFTRMMTIDTQADYEAAVARLVPAHTAEALALYPATSYPSFKDAYGALLTDAVFACPTRAQTQVLAARGTPSYLYQLDRATVFGTATGLGVYHGSELEFVFGNLTARSGTAAPARAFSTQIRGYWNRFAATGSPDGAGATSWPQRTATRDAYLVLNDSSAPASGFHAATCDVIETWHTVP